MGGGRATDGGTTSGNHDDGDAESGTEITKSDIIPAQHDVERGFGCASRVRRDTRAMIPAVFFPHPTRLHPVLKTQAAASERR